MMEIVENSLKPFLENLDWQYILVVVLMAYVFNRELVKKHVQRATKICLHRHPRIALFGGVYGLILFVIRGYDKTGIERLFTSFVFAFAFYELILELMMLALANMLRVICSRIEQLMEKRDDNCKT